MIPLERNHNFDYVLEQVFIRFKLFSSDNLINDEEKRKHIFATLHLNPF